MSREPRHPRAIARLVDAGGHDFAAAIAAALGQDPPAPWEALDGVEFTDEAGELVNLTGYDLTLASTTAPRPAPIVAPHASPGGFHQWRHLPRTRKPGGPSRDDGDYFGEDHE